MSSIHFYRSLFMWHVLHQVPVRKEIGRSNIPAQNLRRSNERTGNTELPTIPQIMWRYGNGKCGACH